MQSEIENCDNFYSHTYPDISFLYIKNYIYIFELFWALADDYQQLREPHVAKIRQYELLGSKTNFDKPT